MDNYCINAGFERQLFSHLMSVRLMSHNPCRSGLDRRDDIERCRSRNGLLWGRCFVVVSES